MKDGFFEEQDLKTPTGIIQIVITLILAICLFSCTGTKTFTTTLDGSKSFDPDGYIVKWYWRQINGPDAVISNNLIQVTPVKVKRGKSVFELTGTDNQGGVGKDTVIVNF